LPSPSFTATDLDVLPQRRTAIKAAPVRFFVLFSATVALPQSTEMPGRPAISCPRLRVFGDGAEEFMRLTLTALTPQGPQDVLVSGDDDATIGDVAAALAPALELRGTRPDERLAPVISIGRNGGGGSAGDPGWRSAPPAQPLWLNGGQADPRAPAARTLRDGAVVSLDQRAAGATSRGEPT